MSIAATESSERGNSKPKVKRRADTLILGFWRGAA